MSSSAFITEHLIRVALNCDGVLSIHISNNNAGGILLEIVLDTSASLNDAICISNAMNNHGNYYIKNDTLTLYCHVLPNGIISDRAEM